MDSNFNEINNNFFFILFYFWWREVGQFDCIEKYWKKIKIKREAKDGGGHYHNYSILLVAVSHSFAQDKAQFLWLSLVFVRTFLFSSYSSFN